MGDGGYRIYRVTTQGRETVIPQIITVIVIVILVFMFMMFLLHARRQIDCIHVQVNNTNKN